MELDTSLVCDSDITTVTEHQHRLAAVTWDRPIGWSIVNDGPKPVVGPDHFSALDMRVGRVTAVEAFPEARNPSWKVTADFGLLGTLSTSAQITHYDREELVGRLVVGAMNLGVRRIAGFRSEFLLLGAVSEEGVVRLLAPDPGAAPGEPIA